MKNFSLHIIFNDCLTGTDIRMSNYVQPFAWEKTIRGTVT